MYINHKATNCVPLAFLHGTNTESKAPIMTRPMRSDIALTLHVDDKLMKQGSTGETEKPRSPQPEQATSPPTTQLQEPLQQPAQPQPPPPSSQLSPSSSSCGPTALAYNRSFQDHCCKMSFSCQLLIHRSFLGPLESSHNNYLACCLKNPKQKT